MAYQTSADFDPPRRKQGGLQRRSTVLSALRLPGRFASALKSFILMSACKKQQAYHAMHFLLATEGKSFEHSLSAFRNTVAGRDLLQRRPASWSLYRDRSMLQACPPASLGAWYAKFIEMHGLDEDYYLTMVVEHNARRGDDPANIWFRTRIDAGHDMRHVLSGYGPDMLGEICLLWFRVGQIRHPGVLMLALFGLLKVSLTTRAPALHAIIEAYRRGRRAQLLDLLPWEDGFAQPLCAQRAALGLTPPRHYPVPFAPEAYVDLAIAIRQDKPLQSGRLAGGA